MSEAPTIDRPEATVVEAEHIDVLIVGAGISGVSAGYHLQHSMPGTSFLMLDAQKSYGGTWYTHKYPGIRSDSDLYTFGYRFKPWTGAPIATAEEIRRYMGEAIAENGLERRIRYQHKVLKASWSSETKRWTVEGIRTDTGDEIRFTANFLWMCQGYYRHEDGFTPQWPGVADFQGEIVHTMHWKEGTDLTGKQVVVIGSGASAATIVPNIAEQCAHVTMLQRTPIFYRTGRNAIEIADELRRLEVNETWIHEIVRRKILYEQKVFNGRSFDEPEKVRGELLGLVRDALGEGSDEVIAANFTPKYRPWQQRIAFVPDADFFKQMKAGEASVKTGVIERFVADGIELQSGEILKADLVVTATGFHLSVLGDIDVTIDGKTLAFGDTRHLPRHDVHRGAEPGLGVRLFPRVMDVAGRSGSGLHRAAAEPHAGERCGDGRAGAAAGRRRHDARAVDRARQLQSGLHHPRRPPPAEMRHQDRMASHPRLLGGQPHDAGGRSGRRNTHLLIALRRVIALRRAHAIAGQYVDRLRAGQHREEDDRNFRRLRVHRRHVGRAALKVRRKRTDQSGAFHGEQLARLTERERCLAVDQTFGS